jgi:hypothetical protein
VSLELLPRIGHVIAELMAVSEFIILLGMQEIRYTDAESIFAKRAAARRESLETLGTFAFIQPSCMEKL